MQSLYLTGAEPALNMKCQGYVFCLVRPTEMY